MTEDVARSFGVLVELVFCQLVFGLKAFQKQLVDSHKQIAVESVAGILPLFFEDFFVWTPSDTFLNVIAEGINVALEPPG